MLYYMADFELKLICTTDLHMEIYGFDYVSDRALPGQGLVHLKAIIDDERVSGPSLVFDNGDFLQGGRLAEELISEPRHPLADILNSIGYDAITLGNHDFDFGLEPLKSFLKQLSMPVISSNLCSEVLESHVAPSKILEVELDGSNRSRNLLKVGIIGLLPPQTLQWNNTQLVGHIEIGDIVEVARSASKALRDEGADIVVALAHTGLGAAEHSKMMENALIPLSHLLTLDAVVGGHTHDWVHSGDEPSLGPVPVVQAGAHAKGVGVIELGLEFNKKWMVTKAKTRLRRVRADKQSPSADDVSMAAIAHQRVRKQLAEPVGKTRRVLTNHLSALGYDDGVKLMHDAIHWRMKALSLPPLKHIATFSSFRSNSAYGSNNFLETDPRVIRQRDVAGISPFNNPLCVFLRSGAQIRKWMADTSAYFQTLEQGSSDQSLRDISYPAYYFDQFSRFEYAFDLSQPVSNNSARVPKLKLGGKTVRDTDVFAVGAIVYRAHGGGNLFRVDPKDLLWKDDIGLRDLLIEYLRQSQATTPSEAPLWTFSPLERTKAHFDITSETNVAPPRSANVRKMAASTTKTRFEVNLGTLAPAWQ